MPSSGHRPLAALLAAALSALLGCGSTTHTVLPPAPPGAGNGAVTIGLHWSPGRLSAPSFQMGLYAGVGGRGAVGGTITNVLLPSSLSGAVYAPSGEGWVSARAHVQNLLGEQTGPTYEVEAAYAPASGDITVRGGVGLVATPLFVQAVRRGVDGAPPAAPVRPVLTLGADLRGGGALASVEAHLGLNRALARNVVAGQRHRLRSLSEALGGLVLTADDVASVDTGDGPFALATVSLRDGRTLTVAARDPYPDCFACGAALRRNGAYPAAPEARPVWISLDGPDRAGFAHALDVDALLTGWRERGVDLRLPPDAADRAASGVPLWHDLSILGGLARDDIGGDEPEAPEAARGDLDWF